MDNNIWRNWLTRKAIRKHITTIHKILSRIGIIIINCRIITVAKTIILHIQLFWITLIIFKKIIITKKNTTMIALIWITIFRAIITMRLIITLSNNKLTFLHNSQLKLSWLALKNQNNLKNLSWELRLIVLTLL